MATFSDVKGYSVFNGVPSINPDAVKEIANYNVRDAFNPQVVDGVPNADETLVRSMIVNGFLSDQPVTVRMVGRELFVIAGHRRLAAVREANRRGAKIRNIAILPEGKGADGKSVRDMAEMTLDLLLSNSGEPLSPPERGTAFLRLRSYGWTDAQIAERAGLKDAKWVRELCKLATMDPRLKALVKAGVVAPTLALETVAAHGAAKAAEIVTAAAKLGKGAQAGRATGKAIAAVTGKAGKNLKPAPTVTVAPAKGAPVKAGTVVPGTVLQGPFNLGKDLDDCAIVDRNGDVLCELPDLDMAREMLVLINQGWHVFKGRASAEPQAAAGSASVDTVIAGKAAGKGKPAAGKAAGKPATK